MAKLGVQLMMVRDKVATDGMLPVLNRLADLGYRAVEVSQIPTDPANCRRPGPRPARTGA